MIKSLKNRIVILAAAVLCFPALQAASYHFADSTQVGSWQTREVRNIDERGRETLQIVKTSLVGEEKRAGTDYVWMEAEMQNFKIKGNGKRKQVGETMILKILMEEKLMKANPEDVMNNMRAMGKEIIMQQGNQDPMLIEEGGMMGNAMMQSMGAEIDYQFNEKGSEKVQVPAGSFKCQLLEGSGNMEMKVLFKKMQIQSKTKQWLSEDVPFGMVKMETVSVVNGKESKSYAKLIDYGKSGAVSQIKGQPQKMNIPGLDGLFGN